MASNRKDSVEIGERLCSAALRKQSAVIFKLIDAKVNPDCRNADGDTALICAADTGCADIIEGLLQRGATPDVRGSVSIPFPSHLLCGSCE
jgi:ankyrin repeat protein